MNMSLEEQLKQLALLLYDHPRATTADLAKAANISRATFNRTYQSRDHLMEILSKTAEGCLQEIITIAKKQTNNYIEAFKELVHAHYQDEEFLVFTCAANSSLENLYWKEYLQALDAFFLEGQKAGVFSLDYSNTLLTELFISMVCATIDAKRRNRIVWSGIEQKITDFFFSGAKMQPAFKRND
jgi:TetR/AcrR family transcriptional repressor of mexCD-oprJ operon